MRLINKFVLHLLILNVASTPSVADVFKSSTNTLPDLLQAISNDTKGEYYRNGADLNITSDLSGYDYTPHGGLSKGVIPRGYGAFDFDESLKEYLENYEFTSDVMKDLPSVYKTRHQLMLLQYSSPAAADLFKHFHTTGLLKMMMRERQYADLQKANTDILKDLITQGRLKCVEQYMKDRTNVTIDDAFQYCLIQDVFADLPQSRDGVRNVLGNTLSHVHAPEEVRDFVRRSIGEVVITNNDYYLYAPVQRVGKVFDVERAEYLDKIRNLVKEYKSSYEVDESALEELSVGGQSVQVYQIRNLAMLDEVQVLLASAQLASQLAYAMTKDQYQRADEYLRRVTENPNIDPVYKKIVAERMAFMREELASLEDIKAQLAGFSKDQLLLIDHADQQRAETIQRQRKFK